MTRTLPRLVLVADDDLLIRKLLRTVLEVDGLDVVEAVDGEDALRAVESSKPTIVLLDVMMPNLDGMEVLRRLDGSGAKVIMLTAKDDPDLVEEARAAGATAFLTKPFSAVQLLELIERLLADG